MKILIIRFSSIGDIVLTTPVLRALKEQLPQVTVHYVTKCSYTSLLENNPYIDQVFCFEKSIKEVLPSLKQEKYTHLIDLHNNIRSLYLKFKLETPSFSFPKLNFRKWLFVRFKINKLPKKHVVERYFEAVTELGVQNDRKKCELFIRDDQEISVHDVFKLNSKGFLSIAIGAQYDTKKMPVQKINEIITQLKMPIVLVGNGMDFPLAEQIIQQNKGRNQLYNACGKYNLLQSASIVKQSIALLTNDTGLMHIASCFQIPTVSVWGNTHPSFGMYPYFPEIENLFTIHQVNNLHCRPCSKIGFKACPRKHFKCMNLQKSDEIANDLIQLSGEVVHK